MAWQHSGDGMAMSTNRPLLRGSPYYFEEAEGLDLECRANAGQLTFLLPNQPPTCNLRCRRCFMPDFRRELSRTGLSTFEYLDLLQAASDHGVLAVELSGEGEPTLSPHFRPLLERACALGLIVTVITNAHSLSRDMLKLLRELGVTLVISLHTLRSESYDGDTGRVGAFLEKFRAVELACEVFQGSMEANGNLLIYRLAIHATVQTDNLTDIPELRAFCDSHHAFFSVAPIAPVGSALCHPDLLFPRDHLLAELLRGHNSIILSHSSRRRYGREVCGTCLYGLNVGFDGALLPDAHAGYELGSMLGSLRADRFSSLVQRQAQVAHYVMDRMSGFCPVRDPAWPEILDGLRRREHLSCPPVYEPKGGP